MDFSDDAILLTVAQAGKRSLVMEVLTANHGRMRCVSHLQDGEKPTLLPGSFLTFQCEADDLSKPPVIHLEKILGGLIATSAADVGLCALMTAKDLMSALVPAHQPAPELYEAMAALMASLVHEDGRWPFHYAAWEFALLEEMNCLQGLARCMTAFRHGDTIYVSPRTGAIVTREEGGAFLDKLIPLPGFLLGGKSASLPAVRQGFELTRTLLERFALADSDAEIPRTRGTLERALKRLNTLPPPQANNEPMEDAESRARRIEAMRPLMVAAAAGQR
ncbi:MAG: DNA repair protein RecO C-terminal domain-containing protein [Pseudomonadota bacterium]